MSNETSVAPTLNLVTLTANIVAAYAAGNHFAAAELPKVVTTVHGALTGLAQPQLQHTAQAEEPINQPTPSQIRKSITPDALISFVDGKAYKTLKRHLGTHGLDPYSYRQRYGLPDDYPMVASNYAAQRSALAKAIGLGRPGGQAERQTAEQE
nr:MucR family transcriptional regulator [Methylobacterium sp. L1A1]